MTKDINQLTDSNKNDLDFSSLSSWIEKIDEKITLSVESNSETLSNISKYLHSLGGKKIRPILTSLSAKLFGMNTPTKELITVAAGIEMIHMATLLHDDIIDQSELRRKKISAYKKFGLNSTLLAGDFLLVRAFGLCGQLEKNIVTETELACAELTEGEILEGQLSEERINVSLEEYLDIIQKKTASLFGLSCYTGTYLATKSNELAYLMKDFGIISGLSFQMIDDILDITSTEEILGKPIGTDLRQKTPSLINILWLINDKESATRFFSSSNCDNESINEAINSIKKCGVIEQSKKIAVDYSMRAKNLLSQLDSKNIDPQSIALFDHLLNYTINRLN